MSSRSAFSWLASLALLVAGSLVPATYLGIVVHAYRARRAGPMATYNQPDPKDLPSWLVRDHDEPMATTAAAALLVLLGATFLYQAPQPGLRVAIAVALATVGVLFGLGLMYFDPGGIFEWWAD